MTKLASYLKENSLTHRVFAERIGVDPSIVSRLTRDDMTPSLKLAVEIERQTGGNVPAVSWVAQEQTGSSDGV